MADLLSRPMSLYFNTKYINRLKHEDVVKALSDMSDNIIEHISAIQITEKRCIISVSDEETKQNILLSGLSLQGKHVSLSDVDNIFTNVTIKDAPFEMADSVLISQLSQFGEVVHGSFSRGKIKNTNIENGTRYVKLINCIPVLPLSVTIGRFKIRLFADNNRTPCKHCGLTSHPYFKCPTKPGSQTDTGNTYSGVVKSKSCFNCKSTDHERKNCPLDIVCHACMKEGHIESECPSEWYGVYSHDILEGREALDDVTSEAVQVQTSEVNSVNATRPILDVSSGDCIDTVQTTSTLNNKNKNKVHIILGDSNCKRLYVSEQNVHNVSLSGQKLKDVDSLAAKVRIGANDVVSSVIVHLGTNDMKDDTDVIIKNANSALANVAEIWPNTPIAFSSIIPRRGKAEHIKALNDKAKMVNACILKLCKTTKHLHFIDNDAVIYDDGKFQKSMYDASDGSGVHISHEGARALYDSFYAFFFDGESDELITNETELLTPASRKRERGSSSATPPSADRKTKLSKNAAA